MMPAETPNAAGIDAGCETARVVWFDDHHRAAAKGQMQRCRTSVQTAADNGDIRGFRAHEENFSLSAAACSSVRKRVLTSLSIRKSRAVSSSSSVA